uniref:Putative WD40 repeat-like protein n=1 Tax=Moniliophthora roreri TaxID=221103 RepID=A0A0W0FUT0_MONRR
MSSQDHDEEDEEEEYDHNRDDKVIPRILTAICEALTNVAPTTTLTSDQLREIADGFAQLEHEVVDFAYSNDDDRGGYDFVPISCGSVTTNEYGMGLGSAGVNSRTISGFLGLMSRLLSGGPASFNGKAISTTQLMMGLKENISVESIKDELGGQAVKPYDPASNPSPYTSPLARFSLNTPPMPTSPSPEGLSFAQARCEITSETFATPLSMQLRGNILAVLGAGGWKNRDPVLELYDLDKASEYGAIGHEISADVGLEGIAYDLQVDTTRKFVYIADSGRIKSYRWSDKSSKAIPVHTLSSSRFSGALVLRNDGAKILRFGSGGMAVWDADTLPTHGPEGRKVIGEAMDLEVLNSWRDNDADQIELSSGSVPSRTLDAEAFVNIEVAMDHPSLSNHILATHKDRYGVACVDLQAGNIVLRYVGHSAYVKSFATSASDPHGFTTAAGDGGVRLYDSRVPAPVMAIDHGEEFIQAVLYEHIGGQPYIIYGGTRSEQVKVWDVRSKAPMYELSTGNNAVNAVAWHPSSQTLFAGTECSYMDRLGYTHDYTRAKFGKVQKKRAREAWGQMPEDETEADDGSEDDDDDQFDEWAWPVRAAHNEESFGYPLDSGEHRIYRYIFKANPDPKVLPEYGQATVGNRSYW